MPVLHKYSDSYPKSGYYVNVNWSAPHPYPLQTPPITEQIYLALGFEAGDKIPNPLTSRLFNAGLHWTEGTGTGAAQKQTGLESIKDTDIPNLTSDQLAKVSSFLETADSSDVDGDINTSALNELQTELGKLDSTGKGKGNSAGELSKRTRTELEDLINSDLSHSQADELRSDAVSPTHFDRSVHQFVRKHPITPHGFTINQHGDPTYTVQTGPVEWTLADCRNKSLYFDWAITVSSPTASDFDLRLGRSELSLALFDGDHLSAQQAANLLTVLPDLLWTVNTLDDYDLSTPFDIGNIEANVPESQQELVRPQVTSSLSALEGDQVLDHGVIVDRPARYLGRIRTRDRGIVCMPVHPLPDNADVGTVVTFDTSQRNGADYATNIAVAENHPQLKSTEVVLTGLSGSFSFYLPDPSEFTEAASKKVEEIFNTVRPTVAIVNETVQEFLLSFPTEDITYRDQLLHSLLSHTPFVPDTFPDLVADLSQHHRIPDESATFRPIPLALCLAIFYDAIDEQKALDEMNRQGDTTILYARDDEYLAVGNELIIYGIGGGLNPIPTEIKKEITVDHHLWARPFIRALSALSETQFYDINSGGDSLINMVLQAGLGEVGLNTVYFHST